VSNKKEGMNPQFSHESVVGGGYKTVKNNYAMKKRKGIKEVRLPKVCKSSAFFICRHYRVSNTYIYIIYK